MLYLVFSNYYACLTTSSPLSQHSHVVGGDEQARTANEAQPECGVDKGTRMKESVALIAKLINKI
jgi:hypothetical protein